MGTPVVASESLPGGILRNAKAMVQDVCTSEAEKHDAQALSDQFEEES
jgi:hypothetical protein